MSDASRPNTSYATGRPSRNALAGYRDETHDALIGRLMADCGDQRSRAVENLSQYIRQRENLRTRLSSALNEHWGSLFRAGTELTYYGKQLEDFACVYSSRASNLAHYPHDHYFRSAMDYLPHELQSM